MNGRHMTEEDEIVHQLVRIPLTKKAWREARKNAAKNGLTLGEHIGRLISQAEAGSPALFHDAEAISAQPRLEVERG